MWEEYADSRPALDQHGEFQLQWQHVKANQKEYQWELAVVKRESWGEGEVEEVSLDAGAGKAAVGKSTRTSIQESSERPSVFRSLCLVISNVSYRGCDD